MNTLLSKSNCTKRIKRKMTKLITNRFQTNYLRKTVCTRLTMTHFDEKNMIPINILRRNNPILI